MAFELCLSACLVLASLVIPSCASETLLVANVIYRHGDRAATGALPIDRVNETFWMYGYGELTDKGKGQQYRLGKWIRARYDTILDDEFHYQNIEVRSSDKDRCLVSAYSNLAGLFSNSTAETDLNLPYIRWQPVPVHTRPVITDEVLAMNRPCNKANEATVESFNSEAVHQINQDYADVFETISLNTGLDLSTNGFRDIWRATDSLFCESEHGLALPSWTQARNISCNDNPYISCDDKTLWQVMVEMSDLQFVVMYNSSVLHRFDGGPLLEDITTKFSQYIAGNRSVQFNMYSAHDTTVAATLSALGIFNGKQPQYTASIMLELHTSDQVIFEVKIFYKPLTGNDSVIAMELPECKSPCSLPSFTQMLEKYVIVDWDTACENNVAPVAPATTILGLTQEEVIVISICSAVVVVLLLTALICWIRRRRMSAGADYYTMRV